MPKVYKQLEKVRVLLEKHYRDMQDMEFTVEEGTLYMLQTRTGKRTPTATFRMAVDMVNEKPDHERGGARPDQGRRHRAAVLSRDRSQRAARRSWQAQIAEGINAVPGAASGKVVFTAHEAEEWAAEGRK